MTGVGRTVRMFLVDGDPTGIVTAEIMNWTGHALAAPRSKLPEVLKRDESGRTGLYFLIGDPVDAFGRREVYIGESDDVGKRISQHSRRDEKDFFERFVIVTSKDQNLTKAHARFLENRLTEIARRSGRSVVINKAEPTQGALPESDVSDMEFFISQVRIVMPVLGWDGLRPQASAKLAPSPPGGAEPDDGAGGPIDEVLALTLKRTRKGMAADAFLVGGEIVVKAGSTADADPQFATNQYESLRDQLIEDGALAPQPTGDLLVFTRDVTFSSPSAAAAVIYGRNSNGRTSWRVAETGLTLKEHQDAQTGALE